MTLARHLPRCACFILFVVTLAGCATTRDTVDPFERYNRAIFRFNERADKLVLEPVARTYRAILPSPVRTGVSNVFANIGDIQVAVNNALQGKFATAYTDFGRIAINSTLGVLGLFDIASAAGIEKHHEDFGQTLGVWGLGNGPFIMIPLLGPSSGRDIFGRIADLFTDPVTYIDSTGMRAGIFVLRGIELRAELLDANRIMHGMALDLYLFERDAYLQRRRSLIYDGAPPPDRDE